jgi:hypothetical protein
MQWTRGHRHAWWRSRGPLAIDRDRSQKADDQMGELTAKEKLIVERIVSHDQSAAQRAGMTGFPFALAPVVCLVALRAARTSDRLEMWYSIAVGCLILSLTVLLWMMARSCTELQAVIRKIAREQGDR